MYIVQMSYLVEKIVVTLMQERDDGRRGQGEETSRRSGQHGGQLEERTAIRVDVKKRAVFTLKVVAV